MNKDIKSSYQSASERKHKPIKASAANKRKAEEIIKRYNAANNKDILEQLSDNKLNDKDFVKSLKSGKMEIR